MGGLYHRAMNYELFMGEALAEARLAGERGERPVAAVAVVNDAMVARAHDRVRETNDPTAHAVVVALREAARRLGTAQLGDVTVFATLEPCAMCVGALLASDVTELVYAVPNPTDGAAGTVLQLAQHPDACDVASRSSAGSAAPRPRSFSTERPTPSEARFSVTRPGPSGEGARPGASGILSRGEVSEWLMVPLSKSGVRKHRGFESRPLRQILRPMASRSSSSDLGERVPIEC